MTYEAAVNFAQDLNTVTLYSMIATLVVIAANIRTYFRIPGFKRMISGLVACVVIYNNHVPGSLAAGMLLATASFVTAFIGTLFLHNCRVYQT